MLIEMVSRRGSNRGPERWGLRAASCPLGGLLFSSRAGSQVSGGEASLCESPGREDETDRVRPASDEWQRWEETAASALLPAEHSSPVRCWLTSSTHRLWWEDAGAVRTHSLACRQSFTSGLKNVRTAS